MYLTVTQKWQQPKAKIDEVEDHFRRRPGQEVIWSRLKAAIGKAFCVLCNLKVLSVAHHQVSKRHFDTNRNVAKTCSEALKERRFLEGRLAVILVMSAGVDIMREKSWVKLVSLPKEEHKGIDIHSAV
uniref:Uncharacterized protein n=1 Tax=Sphaerodactylus townsendi TaxID=933632 RepID=A0ACB8FSH8_9SAUR